MSIFVPAAVGDRAAAGAGGHDAFPAMTAARRTVRRLRPVREQVPGLGEAVDAFLAQPDLAASSRRSYAQTLAAVFAGVAAFADGDDERVLEEQLGVRGAARALLRMPSFLWWLVQPTCMALLASSPTCRRR